MDCSDKESRRCKHGLNLLNRINRLKESSELIDVILVAEGEQFPCHRLVLSSFSPYFKAMFTCGLQECNKKEVILYETTAESVSVILNYMYSSDLHFTNSSVQGIAVTAYLFQMEDIFTACQRYMVDHMDASNCIGIYYFAVQLGAEELSSLAKKYLYRHFAEVCLQEEILEVEVHQLLSLIQSDDLNVSREESILDLVLRWVNFNRKTRAEHFPKLLKQVRLTLVSPTFLSEVLRRNTALVSNSECLGMFESALECIHRSREHTLTLRYGMETTELLLCIGNNGLGIKSRHGSYAEASFCYDPLRKRTYFITSPRYGEALGNVCAGVITENNELIIAGEPSVTRLSRQKNKTVDLCRYHVRGSQFWEKLCSAEYRECYALSCVQNDLYLLGGQMKIKNQYMITNCVEKYSMELNSWRNVSPLPIPLACHTAVTLNDKIYVTGGWTPQVTLPEDEPERLNNRMFRYDPSQDAWTECGLMTFSKYRFGIAVVNHEIYALGGIGCYGRDRGQARRCLDAVEIYNPDGDFWREGPSLPSPFLSLRTNCTNAGVVAGKLYLCGGFYGADRHEVIVKDILELDPWDNQWNVVAHKALMHDSYDICLVAKLNPRDLIPPPPDLVDE
ncbi:kelch repeat and BTB domain-containing protein 12 [Protopterus annectens]|uniref:kelch repeat and BTB domain-containing protein 12 n=1 Tax=Protopterus annectens TaxID=7888 RepID=UPI001CFA7420|nr:kelch repeat and BTB domain-containing protein 12 [Protopterus annectens]